MSLKEVFATLNPEQLEAVKATEGRVLILAGAGSGKTRVLTLRMAYLVGEKGIPPGSLLGLTFTNKAAFEMRARVAKLVPEEKTKELTLCTFHSFCMQLLRNEIHHLGYTSQFSLYDAHDIKRLVTSIAKDLLEHEGQIPSLGSTMSAISEAKTEGLEELGGQDPFANEMYQRLRGSLKAYNAVDFDSLLSLTVELFEKHPKILEKYQRRFHYLMIDEYQDTNTVQYRLAELLTQSSNNLCVVGDDDQSIYGWRGANVKNILQFSLAKTIKLEQNYRSTNTILQAANGVISHNSSRHEKKLWSQKGVGDLVEVFAAPNERDEAEAVVLRLAKMRKKWNLAWKDFAILYRSNALSRQFELALMKHTWQKGEKWMVGIPYQVFGGVEFYERREVKDLLAYLRVIVNPLDQEALLRIINQPRRGIGDQALAALTAYNRDKKLPLWEVLQSKYQELGINARSIGGIEQFVQLIKRAKERFTRGKFHESLVWLIEEIRYKKALLEEVKSAKMQEFKWENVQEFVNALAEFELNGGKEMQEFIATFPLESNWASSQKKLRNDNAVNLMTFHSSKGLEFPVCFLVGMEDHIIPHEKSLQEGVGIEEERRLMYVAITRAMRFLTLSMAKQRKRMGKDIATRPSRFLHEIPKDLLKPVRWDQV